MAADKPKKPLCIGKKFNGKKCYALAAPGSQLCETHMGVHVPSQNEVRAARVVDDYPLDMTTDPYTLLRTSIAKSARIAEVLDDIFGTQTPEQWEVRLMTAEGGETLVIKPLVNLWIKSRDTMIQAAAKLVELDLEFMARQLEAARLQLLQDSFVDAVMSAGVEAEMAMEALSRWQLIITTGAEGEA